MWHDVLGDKTESVCGEEKTLSQNDHDRDDDDRDDDDHDAGYSSRLLH